MKELQKNKKNQNYYFNQHNCFLLQYHLVLITKYRKPVLVDKIKDFFLNYTRNYFTERDLNILEINTNENHVHILFECGTNINLSHFVNAFKSSSSRMIRKNFSKELTQYYWKPYFWSLSYFIFTVSERNTKIVEEYIKNQVE